MTEFDMENPTLADAICELECLADRLEYQLAHEFYTENLCCHLWRQRKINHSTTLFLSEN